MKHPGLIVSRSFLQWDSQRRVGLLAEAEVVAAREAVVPALQVQARDLGRVPELAQALAPVDLATASVRVAIALMATEHVPTTIPVERIPASPPVTTGAQMHRAPVASIRTVAPVQREPIGRCHRCGKVGRTV